MFSKTLALVILFFLMLNIVFENESCPSDVVIFYKIIAFKIHLFGSILSFSQQQERYPYQIVKKFGEVWFKGTQIVCGCEVPRVLCGTRVVSTIAKSKRYEDYIVSKCR